MAKKKKVEKEEVKDVEEVVEDVKEVEEVVENVENDDYEELPLEERIYNIEKKTNIILILTIISIALMLVSLVVLLNGNGSKTTTTEENIEETESASYSTSAFKEIAATDLATESKNEVIVAWIGRQGCGYCYAYAPIITEVAEEYGVTLRYIDFLKIVDLQRRVITDEEAFNAIKSIPTTKELEGAGEDAVTGTPKTLFVKKGKLIAYIGGYADKGTVEDAFEKAGFSKK